VICMKSSIKVIDNALSCEEADRLESVICSQKFPWYFSDKINGDDYPSNKETGDFQFTHPIFSYDSPLTDLAPLFMPLVHMLHPIQVIRMKANLNTQHPRKLVYGFHRDLPVEHNEKIAIFYPTTADGPTVFEDGSSVEAVKNRLVLFPSSVLHSGTTPVTTKCRIVVNMIYQ